MLSLCLCANEAGDAELQPYVTYHGQHLNHNRRDSLDDSDSGRSLALFTRPWRNL